MSLILLSMVISSIYTISVLLLSLFVSSLCGTLFAVSSVLLLDSSEVNLMSFTTVLLDLIFLMLVLIYRRMGDK